MDMSSAFTAFTQQRASWLKIFISCKRNANSDFELGIVKLTSRCKKKKHFTGFWNLSPSDVKYPQIQGSSSVKTYWSTRRFTSPETLLDPPNTGCLYAHAWASSVHSTVKYRPPTWTGDWLYTNSFSCVNVILNGNHQASQSIFKRSVVKCLLPDLQFTRLRRNSKLLVLWQTKNEIVNVQF